MPKRSAKPKTNLAAGRPVGDVEYWVLARRPLQCLLFLVPLLVLYELGVMWTGGGEPLAVRNGADAWMRNTLSYIGIRFEHFLPLVIVVALSAWHLAARFPWRVSLDGLVGMLAESLLFGFLLILLGQLQQMTFQHFGITTGVPSGMSTGEETLTACRHVLSVGSGSAAQAVTFVGAGIYEEFLFRLCLLPAVYGVFRWLGCRPRGSAVIAILSTSLLFAAAHGARADAWEPFVFGFRVLAGMFFSVLFVVRGFGITVGCHAAYDLLVGLMLVA